MMIIAHGIHMSLIPAHPIPPISFRLLNSSFSLRYVEELMRHIEVHSYGKCLHNRDEPADLLAAPDPRWPALEGPQRRARKVTQSNLPVKYCRTH